MMIARARFRSTAVCISLLFAGPDDVGAQSFQWQGHAFTASGVKASVVQLNGEEVLRVERDLRLIPFDSTRLETTVDEPTFVTLDGVQMLNGVVEVKVRARILPRTPFAGSQGFIGIAYRVAPGNRSFECIYLRPNVGRSENQFARNHTVQYFAYPDFKFLKLRAETQAAYETWADVGLDEWITLRIEFDGPRVALFVNGHHTPNLIVNPMKGPATRGTIGLWVDIGTEGYFKDFRVLRQ
jgi:hypothetical protein